jgi:hypothetical protein
MADEAYTLCPGALTLFEDKDREFEPFHPSSMKYSREHVFQS